MFLEINWRDKLVTIEYAWVGVDQESAAVMIFLHEGLGSLSMWREFPNEMCNKIGCRGLVYSRPAYGFSTPRAVNDLWDIDFLHQQALDVLPEVIKCLKITKPVWLFGHSDGGSIALLLASHRPELLAGIIVVAPHLFVEDLTIKSIAAAKEQYHDGDLRQRLKRYHADVDSAFYGWNDIWLKPEFKSWTIEKEVANINCPILALQGEEDPYGTMAQIRRIKELCSQTELEEIPNCGHSPHKEQKEILLKRIVLYFDSFGVAKK